MNKLVLTKDCFDSYLPLAIREHKKTLMLQRQNNLSLPKLGNSIAETFKEE